MRDQDRATFHQRFNETVWARAKREAGEFLSSLRGEALLVFAALAGSLVGWFAPESWSILKKAGLGIAWPALVLLGSWLCRLAVAGSAQRDEARERLREIKAAAGIYEIAPKDPSTAPLDEGAALLRVPVENRGRGARFTVVIERLEGTEEPLLDPFAPLYWMGRKGVFDEEIAGGEGRLVGIGFIWPQGDSYLFAPMGVDGKQGGRSYELRRGETTIWLQLSVQGIPEFDYTRQIGVRINWPEGSDEYSVELAPHDPGDSRPARHVPTIGGLLDF
jgi:hypothetical protein